MNGRFWSGRRVFVTGHTGFKGAWLCHWLVRAGSEVMGYALPPPHEPSLFALTRLNEDVRHELGDIRDLEHLRRSLEGFQPQVVFHLAAQSLVLASYADPLGTFSTNVTGTANVLEAARSVPALESCIVVTSDKCYAVDDSSRPRREDDPLGGSDPYSASKACAEHVTTAYRPLFGGAGRVASVRAGNVIGGGDWSDDRLVPDIVRALTARSLLELRKPDAVRPWQHVLEPLSGYLVLAERLVEDETLERGWNFGPAMDERWRVRDVVSAFVDAWGEDSAAGIEVTPSPLHETTFLALDSTKARRRLGWTPRWSVRDAVERTVAWYYAFYREGADARALVEADLTAYAAAGRFVSEVQAEA